MIFLLRKGGGGVKITHSYDFFSYSWSLYFLNRTTQVKIIAIVSRQVQLLIILLTQFL
jgi:hypothetical protein